MDIETLHLIFRIKQPPRKIYVSLHDNQNKFDTNMHITVYKKIAVKNKTSVLIRSFD